MPRYIDADAFIAEKRKQYCKECDRRKGKRNGKQTTLYEIGEAPCRACGIDDMIDDIEDAPTADVAPVVHAHWIPIYHRMYHCNDKIGEMVQTGYKCSACGIEEEYAWQICRCGARMDEGEKQ